MNSISENQTSKIISKNQINLFWALFSFQNMCYILLLVILWGRRANSSTKHLSLPASRKAPLGREQGNIIHWRSYSVCLLGRGQGEAGCQGKAGWQNLQERGSWRGSESDNTPRRASSCSCLILCCSYRRSQHKSPLFGWKQCELPEEVK